MASRNCRVSEYLPCATSCFTPSSILLVGIVFPLTVAATCAKAGRDAMTHNDNSRRAGFNFIVLFLIDVILRTPCGRVLQDMCGRCRTCLDVAYLMTAFLRSSSCS